jgi:ElaB/YqjD/DUF883 family membrane-anchored ribosome-binding protein
MLTALKYLIMFWSFFVLFSVLSDGGAPIRDMQNDAQTALDKTLTVFADKADSIKEQADKAKEKIKGLSILKKKQSE